MNKKDLSERDICTKFITPAVKDAGWDVLSQIREQFYFTKGRIIVRGKLATRGKAKFADHMRCHECKQGRQWTQLLVCLRRSEGLRTEYASDIRLACHDLYRLPEELTR